MTILPKTLLSIALSTLRISFLSFGGGNAAMGIVQREFVERYKLTTEKEFLQLLSMTNMFPGPVVVNTVTLLGYRAGGFFGGLMAFLLSVFPGPLLVISFVTLLHHYISTQTLLKISFGVIPVVVALLLEFILHSYRKQASEITQKWLYFSIFFGTLLLLVLGIHIAVIFLFLLLFLWGLGYYQGTRGSQ